MSVVYSAVRATRVVIEQTVEVLLVVFVNKDLLEMAALLVKVWGYISVKSNPPPLYHSQLKTVQFCFVVVVVGSLVIFNTLDQSVVLLPFPSFHERPFLDHLDFYCSTAAT